MNNIMPVKKSARQILVWCCVLALIAVFVQSIRAAPPSGTSWGLLYADEFGGSSMDTQKWVTQYPWGPMHNHDVYILRRLAVPNSVSHWTLTTLREKLIKIGAKMDN